MNQTTSLFNPRRKQPLFAPLFLQNFFLCCLALLWSVGLWGQCSSNSQIKIWENNQQYTIIQRDCYPNSNVLFRFFDGTHNVAKADSNGVATITRHFAQEGGGDPQNPFVKTTRKNGSGGIDDRTCCKLAEDGCAYLIRNLCTSSTCNLGQNPQQCKEKDTPANFELDTQIEVVNITDWYFYVILTIRNVKCDNSSLEYIQTGDFFEYVGKTDIGSPNGTFTNTANGQNQIPIGAFEVKDNSKNIYFLFKKKNTSDTLSPNDKIEFRLLSNCKLKASDKDYPYYGPRYCPDTPTLAKTIKGTPIDPNDISVDKSLLCLPVRSGQALRYTIDFQNVGNGASDYIQIITSEIPQIWDKFNLTSCKLAGEDITQNLIPDTLSNNIIFKLHDIKLYGTEEKIVEGGRMRSVEEEETKGQIQFTLQTQGDITSYDKIGLSAVIYFGMGGKLYSKLETSPAKTEFVNCPKAGSSYKKYYATSAVVLILSLISYAFFRKK